MSAADYVFDNSDSIAGERLQLLAGVFDPVSRACLERVGLAPGWSCWCLSCAGRMLPGQSRGIGR